MTCLEKKLMQAPRSFLSSIPLSWLTMAAILLCFPAFLINLGTIAFIGDEGIRSLVALEMCLSGDYMVPTLNGDPYYNKPPLYNWIIYLMSMAFGFFGEWPARVTTLVCLACFTWTTYYFVRRHFDQLTSVTLALMTLTSGRILFWDSMLGLIDICFSWVIYMNFMIMYTLGKAERWKYMFIISYLLFSVAFLLKGLPAVVFQGISILTALQLHGVLKNKLFSAAHWIGLGIGILPVIAYYIAYAMQVDLDHVFSILFDQSMQRTATHHGLWKTFTHIFTFPTEQVYHFLPWSLLVITAFHPRFREWMRMHDFVRFNFWMLVANLPVYWLSVQVYPRYVLMFIPLFNVIGYYIIQRDRDSGARFWMVLRIIFIMMAGLATLAIMLMPLYLPVPGLPAITWFWIGGALCMGFGFAGVLMDVKRTYLWFALCLLVGRIVFNGVVLPIRQIDHAINKVREDCQRLAETHGDETWYFYKETFPHEVARFYTAAYSNQIVRKADVIMDTSALYLVDPVKYPDFPGDKVDELRIEGNQSLTLMRPH